MQRFDVPCFFSPVWLAGKESERKKYMRRKERPTKTKITIENLFISDMEQRNITYDIPAVQ
jgi:hypothetical protein